MMFFDKVLEDPDKNRTSLGVFNLNFFHGSRFFPDPDPNHCS